MAKSDTRFDELNRIYNRRTFIFMNLQEFKNSDLIDEIMQMCVKSDEKEIDGILSSYHLKKIERKEIIRQLSLYHDELFYHQAMYEISGMDEVPTVTRIMDMFDICYYFASYLLKEYMEMI